MPQLPRRLIKVGCLTIVAFVACLAILVAIGFFVFILDARRDIQPMIVHSPGPVSVAHARAACPAGIPFPDSATNIQYASFSLWQAHADYVKFEAPVEDCVAAAEMILRPRDVPATRPASPGEEGSVLQRLPKNDADTDWVDGRPNGVEDEFIKAPWFDPANVRVGFEGGGYGSHAKTVWIDAERGILYYRVTD